MSFDEILDLAADVFSFYNITEVKEFMSRFLPSRPVLKVPLAPPFNGNSNNASLPYSCNTSFLCMKQECLTTPSLYVGASYADEQKRHLNEFSCKHF